MFWIEKVSVIDNVCKYQLNLLTQNKHCCESKQQVQKENIDILVLIASVQTDIDCITTDEILSIQNIYKIHKLSRKFP